MDLKKDDGFIFHLCKIIYVYNKDRGSEHRFWSQTMWFQISFVFRKDCFLEVTCIKVTSWR